MRVIITGGRGQLGSDLCALLKSNDCEVFSFSSKDFDITDNQKVLKISEQVLPDLIINCGAWTEVDACESDIDKAYLVNAIGAKNCAIAAQKIGSKLIHISTDYIFDGNKNTPYNEYDTPNPQSIYAKSKYAGEILVKEHSDKFFILRVAGVYGANGKNFVKTIVNYGKTKDSIKVVTDQITTPTYTIDICHQILRLMPTESYGTYHCSAEGFCSWFEFTQFIFDKLKISTKIYPCTTEEFPRPAKRPSYSVLENFNLKIQNLNVMRSWKDGITDFIEKNGGIL